MNPLPPITIIIVTLNNQRTLRQCIDSLLTQDYPKKNIEYLNVDGGSTDNTLKILEDSPFKILKSRIKKNAEAQRSIGVKEARHNLIVSIDADNYLPHNNWLKQMVEPFIFDSEVVHANTLHYEHKRSSTVFNRYCALFGVLDPIVFYVGIPDRLPVYKNKWTFGDVITRKKKYTIVRHSLNTLPTVGCNGVVYRKDLLMKYAQSSPDKFLHIDVFADLVKKGFDKYAVVNNSVFHDTSSDIITLLRKRIAFLSNYYLSSSVERRYFIYNPHKFKDNLKLGLYMLYTLTIVKPLWDSLRGYVRLKDPAWFIHPIICYVFLLSYGYSTIQRILNKK